MRNDINIFIDMYKKKNKDENEQTYIGIFLTQLDEEGENILMEIYPKDILICNEGIIVEDRYDSEGKECSYITYIPFRSILKLTDEY